MADLDIFQFEIFKKFPELVQGISTRKGGVSSGHLDSLNLGLQVGDKQENLEENFKRFCSAVGVDREHLCIAYQEHTSNIVTISDASKIGLKCPFESIDGFITSVAEVPLMVRFADCQGVFFYEPEMKVVAAVHSGWRGNAKNIIGKAVKKMVDEYKCRASDIVVGISPSLGRCCAEFSDPYKELPEHLHDFVDGRMVDLWEASRVQLLDAGVKEENIEIAGICTVCENERFFSYRGGKKRCGHNGGVIMMKG